MVPAHVEPHAAPPLPQRVLPGGADDTQQGVCTGERTAVSVQPGVTIYWWAAKSIGLNPVEIGEEMASASRVQKAHTVFCFRPVHVRVLGHDVTTNVFYRVDHCQKAPPPRFVEGLFLHL